MTPFGGIPVLLFALGQSFDVPVARDSIRSRELTLAALDQEAVLNIDSALVLYRAARRADSADVVAEYYYVRVRNSRFEYGLLHDEYAESARRWNPRGGFCWTPSVTSLAEMRSTADQIVDVERAEGATPCTVAVLGDMGLVPSLSPATRREFTTRAARAFPLLFSAWSNVAAMWEQTGQPDRSDAALKEADHAVTHPLLRVRLASARIGLRLARGDTVGARSLQRALRSAVLRDGRPGILYEYLEGMAFTPALWGDDGGEEHIFSRLLSLTAASGDWADREHALLDEAKKLIDRGEPLRAIPLATQAITIADSVGVSDLQLEVRILRGRAYLKSGRLADAERDLEAALSAGEHAARLYYRADAWHNLAHLYESEGRWPEAARAVDRFVALARGMPNSLMVTSLHDAGDIRWKAGWHASADATYREMVRAIEGARAEWYFAGQYFERSGDLARARSYYARGIAHLASEPMSLAGMVRVHEALGHADSAESWARAHDAQIMKWPPLEVPLLPAVLARRGRVVEATRIAHAWAERQMRAGNVEGAALARLQVAQLMLDAGHPDKALTEAERTDSLAVAFNLTREIIRARTVRGSALVRLGLVDEGARVLEGALVLARRHPSADILFDARLALGDAFAAARNTDGALAEYDLASRAVEHVTLGLTEDIERAGFRERHLLPFDGAVRVLLAASQRASRTDDLIRWSSRRNAAALALAATAGASGLSADGAAGGPLLPNDSRAPGLSELQARLGAHEALLNFIVLDSTVAAIVVTREGARLVPLSITAANLRTRVEEIRRPLVATFSGHLDLARARYAFGAASALYAALVRPFAPELAGKSRLLIAPDGALHALAFDGLVETLPATGGPSSEYLSAKYLIDSFEVEYVPSPAFLKPLAERAGAQRLALARLLAIGYGAPGSGEEIQAIRDVWPRAQLTTMEAGDATESAVRGRMARFGLLHFAVHAVADPRDPLASHLLLVADSTDDGYLHANEIANVRTSADLVVLSACETNAGPIFRGEGVMGIARAFLASGARAVIGTQWPVGGETAVLMRDFYRRLARGESPPAALRAAKLGLRGSRELSHPFFWAGFVLVR